MRIQHQLKQASDSFVREVHVLSDTHWRGAGAVLGELRMIPSASG